MEELIYSTVYQILEMIISLVFLWIGNNACEQLKKYLNTETKRNLAKDTVAFVEQIYKTLHGEDKKNKAVEKLVKELNDRGINWTTEEIDTLIESAVGSLNQGLKQEKTETAKNQYVEEVAAVLKGVSNND